MKIHAAIGLIALGFALSGCATTTVQSQLNQAPSRAYTIAIVGNIETKDQLWQSYAAQIRSALNEKLSASMVFGQVVDSPIMPAGADAILINGNVTEADKGSAAARLLVGFGAGKAHVTAEFQIVDSNGKQLAKFSVRKAYSGGVGIGVASFLDMDDLAKRLGEDTATTVVNWNKTGKL